MAVSEQVALVHGLLNVESGGTCQGVAAEGRRVRAGLEGALHFVAGHHGAHGNAAGQTLGQGDDVGDHRFPFEGIETAGAAYAGLHFVEDQQGAAFRADAPQFLQIAGGWQVDATLGLNGLGDDRAGTVADRHASGLGVAEGNEFHVA